MYQNCLRYLVPAAAMLLVAGVAAASQPGDPAATPLTGPARAEVIYTKDNTPPAPSIESLPRQQSVTQYGITWTFESPAPVGRFITGDYYVVGPVKVVSVSPVPLFGDQVENPTDAEKQNFAERLARNGSVLNPSATANPPFDSRTQGRRYDPTHFARFPLEMKPGDALLSTISVREIGVQQRMMGPSNHKNVSVVQSAAVLSCLQEPVAPDTFRPSYGDPQRKLYFARDLKRETLPRLHPTASAPKMEYMTRAFERPWIDHVFYGFTSPVDNLPQYGREVGRAAGMATLMLCSDYEAAAKERLLLGVVQAGIDYWGLVRAGHPGYPAHGGHGSGRKWIIVFSGLMLGDEEMQNPYRQFPKVKFGEDMQTVYGDGWTGARALYAGHTGVDGNPRTGWGLYENLPPEKWEHRIGEAYRHCCTSVGWVGQALAIRLMKAEKVWNHDPFLDYCDRWMYEDDAPLKARVKEAKGWEFSGRQGATWDKFVDEMWAKYRQAPGMPPTDGWKKEAAE